MLLEQSGRSVPVVWWLNRSRDGLPSGGTPDNQAAMDPEQWSRGGISDRSSSVSHRQEKRSWSPLWSGEGGAHWLCPCWIFLSTVSETAVPLSAVTPPTPRSPRVPSVTQHPLGAIQGALASAPGSACTFSLALACFWKWDMSSLRSGSGADPLPGLICLHTLHRTQEWEL